MQPWQFYIFNILPADSCNIVSAQENELDANTGVSGIMSSRTSVMLFAFGWLILALVALPAPAAGFW